MTIYLSLLVCLVGALVYGFATNPKLAYMGLVSFGCGMLAFLLNSGRILDVIPK